MRAAARVHVRVRPASFFTPGRFGAEPSEPDRPVRRLACRGATPGRSRSSHRLRCALEPGALTRTRAAPRSRAERHLADARTACQRDLRGEFVRSGTPCYPRRRGALQCARQRACTPVRTAHRPARPFGLEHGSSAAQRPGAHGHHTGCAARWSAPVGRASRGAARHPMTLCRGFSCAARAPGRCLSARPRERPV
jgi:hypothetical protein